MQDREPERLDRSGRAMDRFEDPEAESQFGRMAGKFTVAGVLALAYLFLRPG